MTASAVTTSNPLEDDILLQCNALLISRIDNDSQFARWRQLFLVDIEDELIGENVEHAISHYRVFAASVQKVKASAMFLNKKSASISKLEKRRRLKKLRETVKKCADYTTRMIPSVDSPSDDTNSFTRRDIAGTMCCDNFSQYEPLYQCFEELSQLEKDNESQWKFLVSIDKLRTAAVAYRDFTELCYETMLECHDVYCRRKSRRQSALKNAAKKVSFMCDDETVTTAATDAMSFNSDSFSSLPITMDLQPEGEVPKATAELFLKIYGRLGHPNRKKLKNKLKKMHPEISGSAIDQLPWIVGGAALDVVKLARMCK